MAFENKKMPKQNLEELLPTGSFWWLLESAPDGIVIVDGTGTIILVNAQAKKLFGYEEDDLINKPIESLIPESLRGKHVGYRSDYLHKPQTRPMGIGLELSGLRKDGTEFPVEISLSPVHTEAGLLVMAIVRDVTDYKRDRFISETLQKAMLSSVPTKIDGIHVASAYHSAYTGAQVGGDFFDVFVIAPDIIGIAIGDVSGKGIEASVHTALAKYSLRAYAYQDPTPSSVMKKLNNTVYRQSKPDDFVTSFYATLDLKQGTLTFANAGHMSPLFLSDQSGDISEVVATGPPLGVLPETEYEQHVIDFKSGDQMLLYSDGVTEARSGKDFYGTERLLEFFESNDSKNPDDFISQLVKALEDWSGERLQDDVALLLISMD